MAEGATSCKKLAVSSAGFSSFMGLCGCDASILVLRILVFGPLSAFTPSFGLKGEAPPDIRVGHRLDWPWQQQVYQKNMRAPFSLPC